MPLREGKTVGRLRLAEDRTAGTVVQACCGTCDAATDTPGRIQGERSPQSRLPSLINGVAMYVANECLGREGTVRPANFFLSTKQVGKTDLCLRSEQLGWKPDIEEIDPQADAKKKGR